MSVMAYMRLCLLLVFNFIVPSLQDDPVLDL
jgi:hypothetical protein